MKKNYFLNNFSFFYTAEKLSSSKGNILISLLVVITFLGIGAALLLVSVHESKIAERHRLSTIAFHIAEAGIESALYELRQDFITATSTPSWSDKDINNCAAIVGYDIGPDYNNFYNLPCSSASFQGGSYSVSLKNVAGADDIWVNSTGRINDVSHTITAYVKIKNLSPWDNAIFAGSGASGTMINGNVDIRGSVHILGTGLTDGDLAFNAGGVANIVGNNYSTLVASLKVKVPALPTTIFNTETVETLSAELRVKKGKVGLSGAASIGENNDPGDAYKETVDGVYVTDGYGGNQGANNVFSDNGTTNGYDLGDSVIFPSLSDDAPQDSNYTNQSYFKADAKILTTELNGITAASNFEHYDDANSNGIFDAGENGISMDGSGNMYISGKVYIESNSVNIGGSDTINYTGRGSILSEGNVTITTSVVTAGNSSFPNNIIGVMTQGNMILGDAAQLDIMGLFYAEGQVVTNKQTNIVGTLVTNYFDTGGQVPAIYQVPETVNNLPSGLISSNTTSWHLFVTWMKQ